MIERINLQQGITAIIGGGGKTTFLKTIGNELAKTSYVLLCTTTKFYPFDDIPCGHSIEELRNLRENHHLLSCGIPDEKSGKLGPIKESFRTLAMLFDYVLVEADGSAGKPMKAHASHEPVIPIETNQVICIVGATGFGKKVSEAAHRPEIFAALAGVDENSAVTPEILAEVLNREQLHDQLLVNQTDQLTDKALNRILEALSDHLTGPILYGSLQEGVVFQRKPQKHK